MESALQSKARLRRRRPLACTECRKRKLKCDHERPCTNCQRSRNRVCTYPEPFVATQPQESRGSHDSPVPAVLTEADSGLTALHSRTIVAAEHAEARKSPSDTGVWHSSSLGSVLVSKTPVATWGSETIVAESPANATVDIHAESRRASPDISSLTELPAPPTIFLVKSRYLSPGHWLYSAILNLPTLKWLDREVSKQGECWRGLQYCKALTKSLKTQRILLRLPGQYGRHLPDKALMGELLAIYFRTFERIYRIIHVPTFHKEHETFLEHPDMSSSDFIIRFQLCMALGACMHDDTFSLRPYALQWIHEAQEWLESSEKRRSTISGIQVMCLLHLSMQATESLYGDRVWIFSGTLLRSAMCLGLHRDPATLPRMSIYQAEMRRRLWTTIVELVIDASIDSGQPSLLSSDDYDTELPLNVDDDQIGPDVETVPSAKGVGSFTDTSLQICLARSIPLRLRISKHWSKIQKETSYETILQLSSRISAARRSLNETIRSMSPKLSQFQHQYCDMVFSRCDFTLHVPYLPLSNPLFCHSHKTCTEAALEMSYMTLPLSHINDPLVEAIHKTSGIKEQCSDFTHLGLCGSGSFRTAQHLATSVIAAELTSMADNDGMNRPSSAIRAAELHMLLRACVEWAEKRIRAGQDNVKDYVYFAVILAEVEAKMKGAPAEDAMEKEGLESVNHAVEVLTEMVGDQAVPQDTNSSFDVNQEDLDIMGAFWGDDFPELGWLDTTSQSHM